MTTLLSACRVMRRTAIGVTLAAIASIGHAQAPGASATPADTTPIDATTRAAAIDTLADALGARFVDAATGQRYAATLRAKLADGSYDDATDRATFAARVTADMQAVAADGHLKVVTQPDGPPPRRPGGLGVADPPSVAETKWLEDGIAYIRFNHFGGEPRAIHALRAFVRDHADAKAVIIDTRELLRGGGLAEMDVLFPHFFAKETVLVEMAVARSTFGDRPPPMSGPTLREVSQPADAVLRRQHIAIPAADGATLADAKVFYLTSKRTRSAGEHFALALQRTKRGTLIGEATAGANHFGGYEPIAPGLAVFMPVGRTYDPVTGVDWEGTGITPDIVLPPAQALERALLLAHE